MARRNAAHAILWWSLAALAWGTDGSDNVVCNSAPTPEGGAPIIVGASAALDCCSTNAPFGRVHLQSWQLFTNWLSGRGGIAVGGTRRPLQVRVTNDKSLVDVVTAAYRQHVRDNISLLLGPFGTPSSTAAANVVNQSNALLLCPRASDPAVTQGRPTVFSVTPQAQSFTSCALEALAKKNAKTVAFISENLGAQLSWCRPLATAVQSVGMNLTYSQVLPAAPDRNTTSAALAALRNTSADVVFACMQLQGCLDIAEEMWETGYFPKAMVMPACTTTTEWKQLGEQGLFVTGTVPWLPSMPWKSALTGWTAQEFADLYQSTFHETPPWAAAAAFASLEILVAAIEQANSTDVGILVDQLRSMRLDTVYGTLQFDSNRQLQLAFSAVQATQVNSAPPPVVSPLALAEAPLHYPMPSAKERACMSRTPSDFGYDRTGTCVLCPTGYTSIWNATANARACFFCPPGFVHLGGTKCNPCPAGSITITAGQPQCSNCSVGTYSDSPGQSQCRACASGTFGDAEGATTCRACHAGSFNSEVGQTICRTCLAGTYSAEDAALTCRPCPAGTYSQADGLAACTACSGSRITQQLGAWNESACVCDKGSYFDKQACVRCSALMTTDGFGATSRSACALGDAARALLAIIVVAVVVVPSLFWLAWRHMRRKLRRAEVERLLALERQVDAGVKTITEFQHPMVVVSALAFLQLTDEELQGAHEQARDRGLLRSFDTASKVAEHRLTNPECRIILFSYEWLSWVSKGPNSVQAAWMRKACVLYCQKTGASMQDLFVWLDVLSIPQCNKAVQVLAVNSLYTYAASADALIIIAPESEHEGSGQPANLESYKMRAWTRMELVAQVAAHGVESVYVSNEVYLEVATASWIEDIVNIFNGNMTCCRLKHKGRKTCDKETLVVPLLGVWYLLCGGRGPLTNSGAVLLYEMIKDRVEEVFPTYLAFETENGVEQRPLFGDLIPLLDKHLRLRGTSQGSSTGSLPPPPADLVKVAVEPQTTEELQSAEEPQSTEEWQWAVDEPEGPQGMMGMQVSQWTAEPPEAPQAPRKELEPDPVMMMWV